MGQAAFPCFPRVTEDKLKKKKELVLRTMFVPIGRSIYCSPVIRYFSLEHPTCLQPGKDSPVSGYPCTPFPHITFYTLPSCCQSSFTPFFSNSGCCHFCPADGKMEAHRSSVTPSTCQNWWVVEADDHPSSCTSSLPICASFQIRNHNNYEGMSTAKIGSWFACLAWEGYVLRLLLAFLKAICVPRPGRVAGHISAWKTSALVHKACFLSFASLFVSRNCSSQVHISSPPSPQHPLAAGRAGFDA